MSKARNSSKTASCTCQFIATGMFPWLGDACPEHGKDLKVKVIEGKLEPADPGFVCGDCARARDARWPPGHCATMHQNTCYYCGKVGTLANIGDWNWPDGRPRGMRD